MAMLLIHAPASALIVVEDGTKASGLFKYSSREMSEKVVLSDLHNNPGPIADAMRRYRDERL